MTSSVNHVHKLQRKKYKTGTYFYRCVIPGCAFSILAKMTEGRVTVCWRCNTPFAMTKNDTKWAKPVCESCRRSPSLINTGDAIDKLLGD